MVRKLFLPPLGSSLLHSQSNLTSLPLPPPPPFISLLLPAPTTATSVLHFPLLPFPIRPPPRYTSTCLYLLYLPLLLPASVSSSTSLYFFHLPLPPPPSSDFSLHQLPQPSPLTIYILRLSPTPSTPPLSSDISLLLRPPPAPPPPPPPPPSPPTNSLFLLDKPPLPCNSIRPRPRHFLVAYTGTMEATTLVLLVLLDCLLVSSSRPFRSSSGGHWASHGL
ncbi:unnamed protein product [Arctogadus glacialis]